MVLITVKSKFYFSSLKPVLLQSSLSKYYCIMSGKPIETAIRTKLSQNLSPKYLEIINESPNHNVPIGSETHFKVVVVTDQFENKPLLQRHRMVNTILGEELENGVHALSIVAKTPQQWEESDKTVTPSPNCRGGFGK